MTEESICQVCETDGYCQIQDDKDDSKYNCLINSTWASNQSRLNAVTNLRNELIKYRDFERRARRTHSQGNPERWKARMEILDELNEILGAES